MTPAERELFGRVVRALRENAETNEWEEVCRRTRVVLDDFAAYLAAPEEVVAPPASPYSPDFESFWSAWPNSAPPFPQNLRKRGKGKAWRRWRQAQQKKVLPPLRVVLASVAAHRRSKSWHEEGGRFIPLPETWISQERWDDEPEPVDAGGRYREAP